MCIYSKFCISQCSLNFPSLYPSTIILHFLSTVWRFSLRRSLFLLNLPSCFFLWCQRQGRSGCCLYSVTMWNAKKSRAITYMRCIHKQGTSYFRNEVIKQFQNEPSPALSSVICMPLNMLRVSKGVSCWWDSQRHAVFVLNTANKQTKHPGCQTALSLSFSL